MQLLARMGSRKTGAPALIHDGAARGDVDVVKDQIKCGVDVNCLREGWTPLHMVSAHPHHTQKKHILKKK